MQTGEALAALLCVLAILIPLGLLLTALVLRAAVSIFNRFAGGAAAPSRVPLPSLAKAMLICFATSIVNAVVYVVAALATGAIAVSTPPDPALALTAWLISSPLSLLVMATMLTALLPTTFARALLITLCYVVLAVLLTIGIGFVVAVIAAVVIMLSLAS